MSSQKGHEGSINFIQINSVCSYLHMAEADHTVVMLVRKDSCISRSNRTAHYCQRIIYHSDFGFCLSSGFLLQIRIAALFSLSSKV